MLASSYITEHCFIMMASPKAVSIADLNNLIKSHTSILHSFKECRELCVQSQLFSLDTIQQVDQCCVGFKQLSQSTHMVVKKIVHWLDEIILFFRNIDSKNKIESFKQYSKQANDLAKSFKEIAKWGRDLCGEFHEMKKHTSQDARRIEREHQEAQEYAEKVETRKHNELRRAQKIHESAEAEEGRCMEYCTGCNMVESNWPSCDWHWQRSFS